MSLSVRAVHTVDEVLAAAHLFDAPPTPANAGAFVVMPGHHLLIAYREGTPVGFVSGVQMRHPDKGLEMFVYELGVDEAHRQQGVATMLLVALEDLAKGLGCTALWTATEPDNIAALATYERIGAAREDAVIVTWPGPQE